MSSEPGKPFKLFSGNIEGENVEMSSPDRIVQKWHGRPLCHLPAQLCIACLTLSVALS